MTFPGGPFFVVTAWPLRTGTWEPSWPKSWEGRGGPASVAWQTSGSWILTDWHCKWCVAGEVRGKYINFDTISHRFWNFCVMWHGLRDQSFHSRQEEVEARALFLDLSWHRYWGLFPIQGLSIAWRCYACAKTRFRQVELQTSFLILLVWEIGRPCNIIL